MLLLSGYALKEELVVRASNERTSSYSESYTVAECTRSFTDVSEATLLRNDILYIACRGIVDGLPNSTPLGTYRFEPNGIASRGALAKILKRAYGIETYIPTTPSFNDVPTTNVFYNFIESLNRAGVMRGLNQSQCAALGVAFPCFGPNVPVSRAQAAVSIVNAKRYALYDPVMPTFVDVPSSYWAYGRIETVAGKAIILGQQCTQQTGTCYRPNDSVRRRELSSMIRRDIER